MAKKEYTTLRNVSHDNKDYAIGEPIELDAVHADPLLACGAIAESSAPVKKTAAPEGGQDAPPAAPAPKAKRSGKKA